MSWDLEVCRSLWGVFTADGVPIPRCPKVQVGYFETVAKVKPERKLALVTALKQREGARVKKT